LILLPVLDGSAFDFLSRLLILLGVSFLEFARLSSEFPHPEPQALVSLRPKLRRHVVRLSGEALPPSVSSKL